MYRDDNEALFQRADALQAEVDRLRVELAKERAAFRPTPPPIPAKRAKAQPLLRQLEPGVISAEMDRPDELSKTVYFDEHEENARKLRDEAFLVLKVLENADLQRVRDLAIELAQKRRR